jgi:hypothetical protein
MSGDRLNLPIFDTINATEAREHLIRDLKESGGTLCVFVRLNRMNLMRAWSLC